MPSASYGRRLPNRAFPELARFGFAGRTRSAIAAIRTGPRTIGRWQPVGVPVRASMAARVSGSCAAVGSHGSRGPDHADDPCLAVPVRHRRSDMRVTMDLGL
jgi:hypothetical protein